MTNVYLQLCFTKWWQIILVSKNLFFLLGALMFLRTFLQKFLLLWSLLYIKSWLYLKGWNRYLYICISCIFLALDIRPVGEVTLFLQRWCGWNSSLEAILDVPETWKVTTQNHSLLQRKIQQPNYSSDIVLNNLLIGLRYISFWIFRRRCNMEIL